MVKKNSDYDRQLLSELGDLGVKLSSTISRRVISKSLTKEEHVYNRQLLLDERRIRGDYRIKAELLSRHGVVVSDLDNSDKYKKTREAYSSMSYKHLSVDGDLKPDAFNKLASSVAAWRGVSIDDAISLLNVKPAGDLTFDEYVVSLFQNVVFDPSRSFTFVDIETTGFDPLSSDIIEVAVIRTDCAGNVVSSYDELFGVVSSVEFELFGTGPEFVHHISREMLAGAPLFGDSGVQEHLSGLLNDPNTVVVAHNDSFEDSFLSVYLQDYAFNHESGVVPKLDTKFLSMLLLHKSPNNKLESFVEYNGLDYVGAHRALNDTSMMAEAFFKFKGKLDSSAVGVRP